MQERYIIPRKCTLPGMETSDPWGATSRRRTGKHSDGWCTQPWLKKRSAQIQKQWLYSGDTPQLQAITVFLFNQVVFSPGARQSFFSTVTQSAGHRSVYLHCVQKVHTLKSFEITDNLDGFRIQDSRLPQTIRFTLVYPGLSTRRVSSQWWETPCSPCAETKMASFSQRPRQPNDPRLSLLASVDISRMKAGGHSRCRSRFEEFSPAIAIGAVSWSSIWYLVIQLVICSY